MSTTIPAYRSRIPRFAEAAVERARLTVVPRSRARASRMPFVALVTVVLLGGVVGLLLFNTSMQQASFAATALQSRADALAAREQVLRMDLDRLRDPQRIAESAHKLGMVPACNPAFLDLGNGKVHGEPCPASGAVKFRIDPLPPKKPAAINPAPKIVRVPAPTSTRSGDTAAEDRAGATSTGENRQTRQSHETRR